MIMDEIEQFIDYIYIASTYFWAAALLAGLVIYGISWALEERRYVEIPAVGPTLPIVSYKYASKFCNNVKEMIMEGAEKYPIFRIPLVEHWHVIVSGDRYIEDLRRAPDDVLSFEAAIEEMLQGKYLFGNIQTGGSHTHIDVIKSSLTRNLPALFEGLRDEIVLAFEEQIPVTEDWTKVHAYDAVTQIVAQASNRIFVGVPLCRNKDYKDLTITYTRTITNAREKLLYTPRFLRPLVAQWFTNAPQSVEEGLKHLGPLIEEREKKMQEYGKDYPGKPNDFLSWLMDEAKGKERYPRILTNRILMVNFAAIHTSSASFTHALFELAARPEYLPVLRKEIEDAVGRYGWTKMTLVHMRKVDSLFKESQRYNGISFLSMHRLALKDFTFSDGKHIPKGSFISAANTITHFNEKVYEDPYKFDPFRFSTIREEEGQGTTNQFVATNLKYLAFGHGRHACPGRFFAANELKAMMAHLIITYDIKLENDIKPLAYKIGSSVLPNMMAKVLFRRRRIE